MKIWDAFISHASEDKETVVTPLAAALRAAGLSIWVDQQELRLGDSLREKIDQGLAESRFGIVILSPHFLAKRWPARELNGLLALEESGRKVILPVWHDIDKETLLTYSPILADRLAAETRLGIKEVARQIVQVIMEPSSGSPAVEAPTLARRFIDLLDAAVDTNAPRDFLQAHPYILECAEGGTLISTATQLDGLTLDFTLTRRVGTTQTSSWTIVQLTSPSQKPFVAHLGPAQVIQDKVAELSALRRRTPTILSQLRRVLPDFNASFMATVVGGRRSMLAPGERDGIRRYNEELFGITLRTYDWLVEAAVSLEHRREHN